MKLPNLYLIFHKFGYLFDERRFVGLIWDLFHPTKKKKNKYFTNSCSKYEHSTTSKKKISEITSFMIIAVRFVLESSNSISVFPLTTTRPRPVRYASNMLQIKHKIKVIVLQDNKHDEEKKKMHKKL